MNVLVCVGWQIHFFGIHSDTIKSFLTCTWSGGGSNLRRGESLGEKMARNRSKRRHGKQ